ncbi:N-acetylglucosaminyl-phosphatidylinositol de-N-acetylase isoform X2 [Hemibagrus wyckioides]|uniref:N-acetylglucosaminyl-phosphatidylinositol de-N-acetylase isoform X2 n=1 Tax=Hemibagrus wyckioides TaxID=337641 RepID=UPI00266C7F6E|nr:N-acetylglucosaminyl-phosphatidylinositol de-N-acetylase isoform X2 [Hemibagrus wyckioides]
MFVLLSVTLCFLGYLLCLKLIYNRFNRLWPSSCDSILPPSSRAKGVNFMPTRDPRENDARAVDGVRVLLVTAHPDDECMFFAPAVLKLTESNAAVYLLCLSSGNYYNQGAQRKEELLGSCAVLGIPAHRVTIIDNKELPDDPKTEWSISLTAPLILKHITTYSINLAIKSLIKSPSTEDLHKQTTTNKRAERASAVTKRLRFDISLNMCKHANSPSPNQRPSLPAGSSHSPNKLLFFMIFI